MDAVGSSLMRARCKMVSGSLDAGCQQSTAKEPDQKQTRDSKETGLCRNHLGTEASVRRANCSPFFSPRSFKGWTSFGLSKRRPPSLLASRRTRGASQTLPPEMRRLGRDEVGVHAGCKQLLPIRVLSRRRGMLTIPQRDVERS